MQIQRGLALLLASLFMASMLPAPAAANPLVPYCPTTLAGGTSVTADQVDPALCESITGRVFPEAFAHEDYVQGPNGFTGVAPYTPASDYVGFYEFQAGLDYLAAQYPDYIEVHQVASSFGTTSAVDGKVNNPIYMLEISNENSPVPRDEKLNLLFMLSIHGNEKGGREGGFRVLEDLVKGIGFASETVQNGAGLPDPIEKPTGGQVQTYFDYLDFMNIFLLFPNSDGWACDEIENAPSFQEQGLPCPGLFVRGNGAGTDLNRQTPTIGWQNPSREVLGEPESGGVGTEFPGFANWLVEQREQSNGTFQWNYGIDIHGMLNHKNFGAIMLPAGSMTPQEMHRSLRLAEILKERWNADSHFDAWRTLFQTEEAVWDNAAPGAESAYNTICATVDCPLPGSALFGSNPGHQAGSSQFAEYYTVIDAIGYTDSGFNGDFFAQTTGLNAPGYDIELAYNHITTSSQYEGAGAAFNDYHVWMVRHIVKSFMDAAALDVQISYETDGLRTAYVPTQFVATNLDDVDQNNEPRLTPGGWADQNEGDDKWDYGAEDPFFAYSTKYWEDIRPFLCEGCGGATAVAGVMEPRNANELNAESLGNFDNLIISGSAINQFFVNGAPAENRLPTNGEAVADVDGAKLQAIVDWVEAGGTLVLTDAALNFFDLAGLTDGAVERELGYMGGIRMDLNHDLLNKVRGGVKQTYEPTPLGYGTTGASPNWGIDPTAYDALGGSVAGLVCPGSSLNQNCNGRNVALGTVPLGDGEIHFMGAVLPDPTEEFYHPYGLDHYATTYSANQVVRNMLGWDEVFASPPITVTADGIMQSANERPNDPTTTDDDDAADKGEDSPGVGLLGVMVVLAALGAALGRRRA